MITITKAKPDDTRDIQMVLYRTWLMTYPNKEIGITTEDIEVRFEERLSVENIEKRRQRMLNPSANEFFLVAKDDDVIVGVCGLGIYDDRNELLAIYVLPEYQGKGIGRMFWNEALDFFDPEKRTVVQVATYNEKAIGFYTKLGFIDTGKRFSDEIHKMPVSGVCIPEMEMELKKR